MLSNLEERPPEYFQNQVLDFRDDFFRNFYYYMKILEKEKIVLLSVSVMII